MDLETTTRYGLTIGRDGGAIRVGDVWVDLSQDRAGWLRRVHRADWGLGVQTGTLRALELGTWHATYSWMLEASRVRWVTEPTQLRRSESKLHQWQIATARAIPYPRTIVTSSHEQVVSTFGRSEVIVKPVGTGQYSENGELKTVYAEPMLSTDDRLGALESAPFIVQERLIPTRHLRVVTVGDRTWVAALTVEPGAPADWRRQLVNHSAFSVYKDVSSTVTSSAVAIAKDLQLGYSSQDWVETGDGETFLLDVNPAGQWLFLPEAIGTAIASAIADSLLPSYG
jgi:glutathione synthase/RimK-type ligase-like ATP-grasp enzyme